MPPRIAFFVRFFAFLLAVILAGVAVDGVGGQSAQTPVAVSGSLKPLPGSPTPATSVPLPPGEPEPDKPINAPDAAPPDLAPKGTEPQIAPTSVPASPPTTTPEPETPEQATPPVTPAAPDSTPVNAAPPSSPAAATPVTPANAPADTPATLPDSENRQTEKLRDLALQLESVESPSQLFDIFSGVYRSHDYRAAGLCFAFSTKHSQDKRKEILSQWFHIANRLEDDNPVNFPEHAGRLNYAFRSDSGKRIWIEFVRSSDVGHWQVGPGSIARTGDYYALLQADRPVRGDWFSQAAPLWMFNQRFLHLNVYEWTQLLAGFLLGLLVYWFVKVALHLVMRLYMRVVYRNVVDESRKIWKQIASIAMAFVWFETFRQVVLDPRLYTVAYGAFLTFVTFTTVFIAMRIVDVFAAVLRHRIRGRFSEANVDKLIVPLFSRSLKTIVFCIGTISLAQAFHLPVLGILSGMGLGGIAIAFAAKETVGNFFGSVTVLIDRPFEIGDWIVTDGVEGTVEAVGMRSTRIRTFYNSVVTIPNNNLITAVIDNMGRRRYRRLRTFLTMEYENEPERIEAFCEGIKELILKNPFTLKDNYSVCLYNLQASSIDILLNVFFVCPSTDTEYRERAKLLGNILRLARDMDVRFAYPTQTLYINHDEAEGFRPLEGGTPRDIGRAFATRLLYPDGEEPTP